MSKATTRTVTLAPMPLTREQLMVAKGVLESGHFLYEPSAVKRAYYGDLLATIAHLQALYDAAWAECQAGRAYKALEHEEARLRREYPTGTCNAEDPWSDFGKSEEAANKVVKAARRHHDALRAKGGGA